MLAREIDIYNLIIIDESGSMIISLSEDVSIRLTLFLTKLTKTHFPN